MKITSLVIIFSINTIFPLLGLAQTWNTWVGNNCTGLEYLGTDGSSSAPLEFKTIETGANALNINFWTNGAQQMTILGNNGSTSGYVGIGVASPAYNLDARNDINLTPSTYNNQGYRIGGNLFLYQPSGTTTAVGQAGNPGTSPGAENVFAGYDAGHSANNMSNHATLVGAYAGYNDYSSGSTFIGAGAGYTNTTGNSNTTLGYKADVGSSALTNATAIGANSEVSASNCLVLGDGKINVGIGTSAPAYTLEVKGTIAGSKIIIENPDNQTEDLVQTIAVLQQQVIALQTQMDTLKKQVASAGNN